MKRRHIKRTAALLLAAFLVLGTPTLALTPPKVQEIDTQEELMAWWDSGSDRGEAILGGEVVINGELRLTGTGEPRTIAALAGCIRVAAGGALTIDDPDFQIVGWNPLLQVESGGSLALEKGRAATDAKTVTIVVEQGGLLTCSADFVVIGTVSDKNSPVEPEPERRTVYGVHYAPDSNLKNEMEHLSGTAAAELVLPETATVLYETETEYLEQPDVPLHWDLSALPTPLTKGRYLITGTLNEDALKQAGLENPDGIAAEIALRVLDAGPFNELEAGIKELPDGVWVEYKNLPLPTGTEAVYAEYSLDGASWLRVKTEDGAEANFLEDWVWSAENGMSSFSVKLRVGSSFYTRLLIVGSPFAGASNVIKFGTPGVPDDDTDDSGGNRGGGGQGESDRDKLPAAIPTPEPSIPPPVAETIAPIETPAPSPTPPPNTRPQTTSPTPPATPPVSDRESAESTKEPQVPPDPAPPQEPNSAPEAAQSSANPEEETGAGHPISAGTVTVAAATVLTAGGIGLTIEFIRKRKP